jgi:hypothetical protein
MAGSEKTWEVLPPEDAPRRDQPGGSPSTRARLGIAFAVAVVSDALSIWLEFVPPLQWTLDIATAVSLFLILGRQWLLLPPLISEAIPGLAMLPAWTLVVASIAAWGTVTPFGGQPGPNRP